MSSPSKHKQMCFLLPSGECLLLSESVLSTMYRFRQNSPISREAGGQLFASISERQVTIVAATEPGILDIRRRFGFQPSRKAAQKAIDRHYALGLHFVGEWHTHPERHPTPSNSDLESMSEMVTLSSHALSGYIMLILGTEVGYEGLHASIHKNQGWQRLTPCKKLET